MTTPLVKICAWYKKTRVTEGLWKRESEPVEHPMGTVTHSICPACAIILENETNNEGETK